NHTFALPLRGNPLDKKPHRKGEVPDKAKDNEIAPVQAKEPVFFANPGDCDKCESVHKQCDGESVIQSEVEEPRSITLSAVPRDPSTSLRMTRTNYCVSTDSAISSGTLSGLHPAHSQQLAQSQIRPPSKTTMENLSSSV